MRREATPHLVRLESNIASPRRLSYLDAAREIHRRYPVVDGHADSVLGVLSGERKLAERSELGHLDFGRALEAGVAATVQTAWPSPAHYPVAAERAMEMIGQLLDEIDAADAVTLAASARDIQESHAAGSLAVILGIEGAEPLHGNIRLLSVYYRLGVRVLQPVWNHRNAAADGALEEDGRGGLSVFGQQLVREMNRLGMVLDLSHLNAAGFFDALERSEDPVIFSHGNCRALYDHRRNLTDEQIRALAARIGVFGISFVNGFMSDDRADVTTVADHVDHAVQVAGPAGVAYGSDFDGTDLLPAGLEDVQMLPHLTAELLARGYTEPDLRQIVGGNYLRVLEQVIGS